MISDFKKCERNEYGLLKNPSVEYVFNENGYVDWRKMIRKEFLVANRSRTQESDVEKLEDKDLLILLGGIKELAQLRGYTDVKYNVVKAERDYVCTSCEITWIGNYETNDEPVKFQALADAHFGNTNNFAVNFLAAIAENRAFTRCVRSFLKINIVGQDEIGGSNGASHTETESASPSPVALLKDAMAQRGISVEELAEKLGLEGKDYADNLVSESDLSNIPKLEIMKLIKRLKKR
jgi:hypothetical protein